MAPLESVKRIMIMHDMTANQENIFFDKFILEKHKGIRLTNIAPDKIPKLFIPSAIGNNVLYIEIPRMDKICAGYLAR
jgi:hypothetical protein